MVALPCLQHSQPIVHNALPFGRVPFAMKHNLVPVALYARLLVKRIVDRPDERSDVQ